MIETVASLGRQLNAETFVIGIPLRAHASRAEEKYRTFAQELRERTAKEVVLWDESLSTVEAAEQLRASGKGRRDAQREIDMVAAAVILQSYLDDLARRTS